MTYIIVGNTPDTEREFELGNADVAAALDLAIRYGQIDGAHHKTWVIDQMVRALTGGQYEVIIALSCAGEDGPNTYEWDEGIAP